MNSSDVLGVILPKADVAVISHFSPLLAHHGDDHPTLPLRTPASTSVHCRRPPPVPSTAGTVHRPPPPPSSSTTLSFSQQTHRVRRYADNAHDVPVPSRDVFPATPDLGRAATMVPATSACREHRTGVVGTQWRRRVDANEAQPPVGEVRRAVAEPMENSFDIRQFPRPAQFVLAFGSQSRPNGLQHASRRRHRATLLPLFARTTSLALAGFFGPHRRIKVDFRAVSAARSAIALDGSVGKDTRVRWAKVFHGWVDDDDGDNGTGCATGREALI